MKAIIIEDEHLIAMEMKATVKAVAPDVETLAILPSLHAATKWFSEHAMPDLIFMDIKISDGLSFELFEQFAITCPVIFCTAYEEYAIRAFKVNGVDYLLKPVQEEDLEKAISKVRAMRQTTPAVPPDIKALMDYFVPPAQSKNRFKERFIVNALNKWLPVETKDIALICRDTLVYFFKFNGEKIIYDYSSLEDIQDLLDPDLFFRANRQTIININSVLSVKPLGNQKLVVQLKPPLKLEVEVSRDKAPLLRKWMDR